MFSSFFRLQESVHWRRWTCSVALTQIFTQYHRNQDSCLFQMQIKVNRACEIVLLQQFSKYRVTYSLDTILTDASPWIPNAYKWRFMSPSHTISIYKMKQKHCMWWLYIYIYIYIYVYMYVCVYIYIYIYIYIYMYTCMCVCIYICVCVCMYVYIYIYIYIYIKWNKNTLCDDYIYMNDQL